MKKLLYITILICFILSCNRETCKTYRLFFTDGYLYDTLYIISGNVSNKECISSDPTTGLAKYMPIKSCDHDSFSIIIISLQGDTLAGNIFFLKSDSNILIEKNGGSLVINSTNRMIEFR